MDFIYKIYLDVCCLNRLYDDQTQLRIRLEAEAIAAILSYCQSGKWQLVSSTVIESEIDQTPSTNRKEQIKESLSISTIRLVITPKIIQRMTELTALNFKDYDALHLACAEENATIFLTTDDPLLRKSVSHKDSLKIRVANPIIWFLEINQTLGE